MSMTFSSGSPLGVTIEAGEIAANAVTYAKLGSDFLKCRLIESVSASADSSITSSATITGDTLLLLIRVTGTNNADLNLTTGGTGSTYAYRALTSTTLSWNTAQSALKVGLIDESRQEDVLVGYIVKNVETDVSNPKYTIQSMFVGTGSVNSGGTFYHMIDGNVAKTSGTISSFTLAPSAGTITGTMDIYEVI